MPTRNETLLEDIIITNPADDITPQSRNEIFLKCCAQGVECTLTPHTHNETLLKQVAHKIVTDNEAVGKPIEVSTAAEMDALLIADNVGKSYQYTGTTDSTYTNGDIYVVEVGT